MNEYILENYNSMVGKDDICLHLGDLGAGLKKRNNEFKDLLKKLNGRKILLKGNHDYFDDDFYLDAGFEEVGIFLSINGYFLNHYPLDKPSNDYIYKEFLKSKAHTIIHGHTHKNIIYNDNQKRINVCVELTDFKPILLDL